MQNKKKNLIEEENGDSVKKTFSRNYLFLSANTRAERNK